MSGNSLSGIINTVTVILTSAQLFCQDSLEGRGIKILNHNEFSHPTDRQKQYVSSLINYACKHCEYLNYYFFLIYYLLIPMNNIIKGF